MRSLIGTILVALMGFYIAWPIWSLYRIHQALEAQEPDLLAAKIDFDGVRESLKPAVEARVRAIATEKIPGDSMTSALGREIIGKLTEPVLRAIVTPARVIRIYADAKAGISVEESVTRIVKEQIAALRLGALAGLVSKAKDDPAAAAGAATEKKDEASSAVPADTNAKPPAQAERGTVPRRLSLDKVKGLALVWPFAYEIDVARHGASKDPDATITLAFQGGDWKVTAVTPRRPALTQ